MESIDGPGGTTPRESRRRMWIGVLGGLLTVVITLRLAGTHGTVMAVIAAVTWGFLVLSEVAFARTMVRFGRSRPVLYGLAVYPLPVFTAIAATSPFLSLAVCAFAAGVVTVVVVIVRAHTTPRHQPASE